MTAIATEWETVIGLEVHVELRTATKLFCGCRNSFGEEPNTNVCPVCLGLPGSLPVLNRAAVEFAMRIGTALHCRIQPSIFHRKNYFYPDMPKDYQISQYDLPINVDGWLDLPTGRRVGIVRAHLEEDTGKSTHIGGGGRIHDAAHSLVDFNRAGVPLVEIVSAPDLRRADEARAYVDELRAIVMATGASDGKMEEGSLRVDADVSVRPVGSTELRHSVRDQEPQLPAFARPGHRLRGHASQVDLIGDGGRVIQETRHWDENAGVTGSMRSKEEAEDYRYFPEPDLVPVVPSEEWKRAVAESIPALPGARRMAVAAASGFDPTSDAVVTIVRLDLDRYVHGVAEAGGDAALAVRGWLTKWQPRSSRSASCRLTRSCRWSPWKRTARSTTAQARTVLKALLASGGDPQTVAARLGFEAMAADDLAALVDQVAAEHPAEWERYIAGEDKVAGFFIGQIKSASDGKADLKAASALLRARHA